MEKLCTNEIIAANAGGNLCCTANERLEGERADRWAGRQRLGEAARRPTDCFWTLVKSSERGQRLPSEAQFIFGEAGEAGQACKAVGTGGTGDKGH